MDESLYDEFGNYVGPELESGGSSEEEDVQDVWGAPQQREEEEEQETEQQPDREELNQPQQVPTSSLSSFCGVLLMIMCRS